MPRNIFITGGMGGIGQSCVRKFIAQGDLVTFTFAEDKANFAAAEKFAESCNGKATAVAIDMSDAESIRKTLLSVQSKMLDRYFGKCCCGRIGNRDNLCI